MSPLHNIKLPPYQLLLQHRRTYNHRVERDLACVYPNATATPAATPAVMKSRLSLLFRNLLSPKNPSLVAHGITHPSVVDSPCASAPEPQVLRAPTSDNRYMTLFIQSTSKGFWQYNKTGLLVACLGDDLGVGSTQQKNGQKWNLSYMKMMPCTEFT